MQNPSQGGGGGFGGEYLGRLRGIALNTEAFISSLRQESNVHQIS